VYSWQVLVATRIACWRQSAFTLSYTILSMYRIFQLKHNPNHYTWTPSCTKWWNQWQYWIPAAVSLVTADSLLEISMAIISAVLSLNEHFSQIITSCVLKFCYQSVCCCLIWYFLFWICTAKCFTNSSKQLWCEVIFENEHMFCSRIHHVCTCSAFKQLAWGKLGEGGLLLI
jgi:hypothetical protein